MPWRHMVFPGVGVGVYGNTAISPALDGISPGPAPIEDEAVEDTPASPTTPVSRALPAANILGKSASFVARANFVAAAAQASKRTVLADHA
ncbi:hypothetical protein T484DRAFT_1760452 [Baffinella frigidus]|nr:hypothetical protein T484DRAFT_1760452 [Cryptophyta sp. CCMP2293]